MRLHARFDLFPDDTNLGRSFNHSNFDFASMSNLDIAVNETSGEKGITIRPAGVSIIPPAPVSTARFRTGIFDSQSINVLAKDTKGRVVAQKTCSQEGFYDDSLSAAADIISYIEFQTNGKEELLVSISVDI